MLTDQDTDLVFLEGHNPIPDDRKHILMTFNKNTKKSVRDQENRLTHNSFLQFVKFVR